MVYGFNYSSANEYLSSDDAISDDGQSDASCSRDDVDSELEMQELEQLLYSQVHYDSNAQYDDNSNVEIKDLLITDTENASVGCQAVDDTKHVEEQIEMHSSKSSSVNIVNVVQKVDGIAFHNDSVNKSSPKACKRRIARVEIESDGDCAELIVSGSDCEGPSSLKSFLTADSSQAKRKRFGLKHVTSTPAQESCSAKPIFGHSVVSEKSYSDSDDTSSSYDALCYDSTSENSSSMSVRSDDIQLNCRQNSDLSTTRLRNILKGLPDCDWSIGAVDSGINGKGNQFQSRYYQSGERRQCANCSQRGHLANMCPLPKKLSTCILCGKCGHISRSCPDALCYNCHTSGHSVRDCEDRRQRRLFCGRCRSKGHDETVCPEIWRQYHLTTDVKLIKSSRRSNENKCCYNCADRGHYGHECKEERFDSYTSATMPFITRYDKADDKKHLEKHSAKNSSHKSYQVQDSEDCEKSRNLEKKTGNSSINSENRSLSTNRVRGVRGGKHKRASRDRLTCNVEDDFPRSSRKNFDIYDAIRGPANSRGPKSIMSSLSSKNPSQSGRDKSFDRNFQPDMRNGFSEQSSHRQKKELFSETYVADARLKINNSLKLKLNMSASNGDYQRKNICLNTDSPAIVVSTTKKQRKKLKRKQQEAYQMELSTSRPKWSQDNTSPAADAKSRVKKQQNVETFKRTGSETNTATVNQQPKRVVQSANSDRKTTVVQTPRGFRMTIHNSHQ